jgi:hypothetical protein
MSAHSVKRNPRPNSLSFLGAKVAFWVAQRLACTCACEKRVMSDVGGSPGWSAQGLRLEALELDSFLYFLRRTSPVHGKRTASPY